MFDRMLRAALLQPSAYAEAERGGPGIALQAVLVVALVGVLASIGGGLGGDDFVDGVIAAAVAEIVGWLLWALVTFYVGTRLFSAKTTFWETARTLAFAYSPGALLFFRFIPILGTLIAVAVFFWRLIAGYVALKVALDINPLYTLMTAVISFIPRLVLGFIAGLILDLVFI